jgi:hypothetical protein
MALSTALAVASLVKGGVDAYQASQRSKEAQERAKMSPAEKKALQRARNRAADPMQAGRTMEVANRQLKDQAEEVKQNIRGASSAFLDKTVVAKKIADTVDVKTRAAMVDMAERIAQKNAQAKATAEGQLSQLEMGIESSVEQRKAVAREAKRQYHSQLIDFGFNVAAEGIGWRQQNQINDQVDAFYSAGTLSGKKNAIQNLAQIDPRSAGQLYEILLQLETNPKFLKGD